MKQPKTFLLLSVIVAVLVLGIAYAAISAVNLTVTGNVVASPEQGNFKVRFAKAGDVYKTPVHDGVGTASLVIVDDDTAEMNVTGLKTVGDTFTVTFEIENYSTDIAAKITSAVASNTNPTYFDVSVNQGTVTVNPGETGEVTVTVRLKKSPVDADVTTRVELTYTATPETYTAVS